MIKKYILIGLMAVSFSPSIEAFSSSETERIFDLTSTITLWQNMFLALFGNKMHAAHDGGMPETANYRDSAVLLGNALQFPVILLVLR
ncbi:hypothetical protein FJ365_01945 [Candidatus Dependentiae bacterium]|nr:hypothetical protein [Candidatus Dependentiae bacterium]